MRIARSSTPKNLVLQESIVTPAGLTLLFLALGVGFLSMALDSTVRVRTFSDSGPAGPASRIAWTVFGLVLLVGAGFFASQRRAVSIDGNARSIVEHFGIFLTWKRRTRAWSECQYVLLTPEEYGASLSIHGARFVIPIDVGRRANLAPLAQQIAEAMGLPLVSKIRQ